LEYYKAAPHYGKDTMLIGTHLSIAGGLYKALELARSYRFQTCAMFLRNQRQWKSPPLTDEQVELFRDARSRWPVSPIVAHGSYLLNLAGGADIRRKSIEAMIDDIGRCERLGIEYLVIHPGSNADAVAGVVLVASGLNAAMAEYPQCRTKVLLETTAGAGNVLGGTFEQIAEMLSLVNRPGRYGVCLDTCHVFAAGYDIKTPGGYASTMAEFDRVIGMKRLKAIHANDSLRERGCRIDRHAHIGHGQIGLVGFRNFMRDARLAKIPMILETPKGLDSRGRDYDRLNAAKLRRLARGT